MKADSYVENSFKTMNYTFSRSSFQAPATRTTTSPSPTTPRVRLNASCDFDIDQETCGWKSDTVGSWLVIQRRDTNLTIGPTSDYTSISKRNLSSKLYTFIHFS